MELIAGRREGLLQLTTVPCSKNRLSSITMAPITSHLLHRARHCLPVRMLAQTRTVLSGCARMGGREPLSFLALALTFCQRLMPLVAMLQRAFAHGLHDRVRRVGAERHVQIRDRGMEADRELALRDVVEVAWCVAHRACQPGETSAALAGMPIRNGDNVQQVGSAA